MSTIAPPPPLPDESDALAPAGTLLATALRRHLARRHPVDDALLPQSAKDGHVSVASADQKSVRANTPT